MCYTKEKEDSKMKMLKEIKERWASALRSGKYRQGTAMLQDSNKNFCCLGVLCNLYNKEKHRSWEELNINGEEILPIKVMAWAGLLSQNPNVAYESEVHTLSAYNDGEAGINLDFNQIADLIEAQL